MPRVAALEACCVVSPHPDDAVLGAWHVLASAGDVRVVTVFAGVPGPGVTTTLDRARGGGESAAVVRRRREDDRAALAVAGREPIHLDLQDVDYRAYRHPRLRAAIDADPGRFIALTSAEPAVRGDAREIAGALEAVLRAADTVYVPASIGGHPDHADVALAGLALARRGRRLRLYADIPYLLRHGPPSWLGERPNPPADAAVRDAFAALGLDEASLERAVVRLDPDAVRAKMEATRRYGTEYALVDADFGGALSDPEAMAREVVWTPSGG